MTNTHKGLIAVHLSVLIFGLTALFSKLIALNATEITLLRSLIAAVAITGLFLWKKNSLKLNNKRDYVIALLLGVLLAIHWVTYFHAMQISSIAVGVIALYTFPIITVLLEPWFSRNINHKKIHRRDIFSSIAVLFGIYCLIPDFSFDNNVTQGILWGVFSAFCFALRNLIQGHYFTNYTAQHSLLYQTAVSFIVILPFSFQIIPMVTANQWMLLFLLGIFFTALPHILFAYSLLQLRAKTVSLIACVQVVYATVFALLLLNEETEFTTYIGGLIVVSVAMYESLFARRGR